MIEDLGRVRAILEADRAWSVYALGDLEPPHAEHAEWRLSAADGAGQALLMLYHGFGLPVLFTCGPAAAVRPLLDEVARSEPSLYLLVQPEIVPLVEAHYTLHQRQAMWRMTLAPGHFQPAAAGQTVSKLSLDNLGALEALYADGAETGEAPDFFSRAQVEHGLFYGVWEDRTLIAAAGTHLVSARSGVATVGNVYVRRDRRGKKFGAAVTGAITAALIQQGFDLIALNVNQDNAAAIHVYEGLGYRRYCAFYEGLAQRS